MRTAVLDACVLYSAPLRDLWMHLAVQRVSQPKWTARIQEEWIRKVLKNRPDPRPGQLIRTRECMERWGRDWEVPGFEALIPELALPDPDDRHVLAAAIAAQVPIIVTFNLADFPQSTLAPHGVRAVHPDLFASELLAADPEVFVEAVRTHRKALRNPPKSSAEYLDTLRGAGLPRAAASLQAYEV